MLYLTIVILVHLYRFRYNGRTKAQTHGTRCRLNRQGAIIHQSIAMRLTITIRTLKPSSNIIKIIVTGMQLIIRRPSTISLMFSYIISHWLWNSSFQKVEHLFSKNITLKFKNGRDLTSIATRNTIFIKLLLISQFRCLDALNVKLLKLVTNLMWLLSS